MYFDIVNFEEKLKNSIIDSDKIIVTPHVYPDFDSIGSAIGVATICRYFGKKAYILVNEKLDTIDFKVSEVIKEASEDFNFINLDEYLQIKSDNDLLVTTDVNKRNIVHVEKYLDTFKNIFIIDHHKIDDNTINTSYSNMYIDIYSSSASEIVTKIMIDYGITFDSKISTYLYSGIVLDTNRFMKSTTSQTMIAASELLKRGANIERANYLLKSNNIQNLKIYKLVNSAKLYPYKLGLAGIAKEDRQVYEVKEIAIAADRILNGDMAFNTDFTLHSIDNLNVAFAMGPIDRNNYRISARSTESGLDVGEIMKKIGGGGTMQSAAAEVSRVDIMKVFSKLHDVIKKR